ncbi:ABC-type multidrug transport system ATPase subunit [Barrientosiimonas humi]|uniref:ABC-type multidrug transport system ATPase subunit n=1 Tax=Barrientosiimonas humi TaxID=999931 RepID=A0A542X999_9MICO|nr:ATP-binding cassette domain-containing protein [Barrientosiimonas humi]TQL32411.1 ABC-type multidrug transport system ATPase subunit [Barrientosiimonas humi]CAG7572402.1 ABC transporter ATP-binding/permease protein [Barrientosiimonas humi]
MTQPTNGPAEPTSLRLVFDGRASTVSPGQRFVIGRDRGCDLTVVDSRVSRRHAEVRHEGGAWVVVDLGSSNGTYVGARRIAPQSPAPIGQGGSLRLGAADGPQVRAQVMPGGSAPRPQQGTPRQGGAQPGGAQPGGARPGNGHPSGPLPGRAGRPAPAVADPTDVRPGAAAPARPTPAQPAQAPQTAAPKAAPQQAASSRVSQPLPQHRPAATVPDAPGQHAGVVFERWTLPSGPISADQGGGHATVTGQVPQVMPTATTGTAGGQVLTIGRGLENQIVVDDLLASRQHVRLTPRPGGFDVQDLDSRNGTYVNGQKVDHAFLGEGGLLAVGHSRFTVRHGQLVASVDEGDVNFVANHLTFKLGNGKVLLDDVTFALDGSSLLAVIGPSGAGKSTLLKALTGSQQATEGEVYYDGRDLYENYQDLRHRIGVVPQDDVVHRQLTVKQALRYAAELRFPDDLDAHLRDQRVDEVMAELDLAPHADTRVDKLSGGQRKRTSVALELLTRPSLLFLDEPTSGLDPGLDKQVMRTLRDLADGGRTVVVITHSVANLGVCDKVLLLAPGGKVAYFGPPDGLLRFFGASDHADVFTAVARDPEGVKLRFRDSPLMEEQVSAPLRAPRPHTGPPEKPPRQQSIPSQLSTLARRHLKVILADKGYAAFMLLMPVVLAVITMVVPGSFGLGPQPATDANGQPTVIASEPLQILVVLIVGAIFMGTAASVRELVSERAIFLREKAVGLSSQAYLWGKLVIFGLLTLIQSALLVGLVLLVKEKPADAILLGSPTLELIIVCWFTAFSAVSLGLLMSSFVKTSEQVMPLLVVSVMAQLVLCGGLFPVTGRPVLEQLSWITPSRWGYAGSAAVVNIREIFTRPDPDNPGQNKIFGDADDPLWQHTPSMLLLALGMLALIGLVMAACTLWRINREDD